MISVSWRELLPENVVTELDQFAAGINAFLLIEHNEDGTHGDITVDSLVLPVPLKSVVGSTLSLFATLTRQTATPGSGVAESDVLDFDRNVRATQVQPEYQSNPTTEIGAHQAIAIAGLVGGTRSRGAVSDNDWIEGADSETIRSFVQIDVVNNTVVTKLERWLASGMPWDYVFRPGSLVTASLGTQYLTSDYLWDEIAGKELYISGDAIVDGDLTVAGAINGGDFGSWTSYSPAWTSTGTAPAIVNGTITGSYARVGNTVTFRAEIVMGGSTTFGTGSYRLSLPSTAAAITAVSGTMICTNAGVATFGGIIDGVSTTTVQMQLSTYPGGDVPVTNTVPFTFGSTDSIRIYGTYEEA